MNTNVSNIENNNNKTTENLNKKGKKGWLKKLGIFGFLFFFIKGLVWIAVAVAAYYGFTLF